MAIGAMEAMQFARATSIGLSFESLWLIVQNDAVAVMEPLEQAFDLIDVVQGSETARPAAYKRLVSIPQADDEGREITLREWLYRQRAHVIKLVAQPSLVEPLDTFAP